MDAALNRWGTRAVPTLVAAGGLVLMAVACGARPAASHAAAPHGTVTTHPCATEAPGPLVDLETARHMVGFPIGVPDSLPSDVLLAGVLVDDDAATVRVHFSDGVVLFEYPSQDTRPVPQGLEFDTTVNGHPALGVRGDSPPTPCAPVSQLKWWTGEMFFDLYGPVPFDDVRLMADSVP